MPGRTDLLAQTHVIFDIVNQGLRTRIIRLGSFLSLSDVPETYTDQAGRYLRVNPDEDGIEFATLGSGGDADEKVGVDSAAIPGYIGATSGAGVLRTASPITKTDHGDYVTIGLDQSLLIIEEGYGKHFLLLGA